MVIPTQELQAESTVQGVTPEIKDEPTPIPQVSESDPAVIQAAWQSSPHADTFVLDANGQNNTCARCHAPINWMPSMDDLPESCFACKFELEAPPALIPEAEWGDVPCNICHKVDKKGNIQPEYAWLEIAPLGEYASVATISELCLKCHTAADIPGHVSIQVSGAHAGYDCSQCHSVHDTQASCNPEGCHSEPGSPIPGHDADHQAVTCVACHDGSEMEVGPDAESGLWTTFTSSATEASLDRFTFTSHNVVLKAPCERCHFVGNPWALTESVDAP